MSVQLKTIKMTSRRRNAGDSSSSDESECEPLWDSSDESDTKIPPPKKRAKRGRPKGSKSIRLEIKESNTDDEEEEDDDIAEPDTAESEGPTEAITVTVGEDGTARSKLFIVNDAQQEGEELQQQDEPMGDADADDREPYEVRRFSNFREVITYMGHYEQETMTHFTSLSRNGKFGEEKRIPNVHRGRIYFESLKGKCGMPIAYDGTPFIHVGRWSFGCHQGIDRNTKQKQQYYKKREEKCRKQGLAVETRKSGTKKVNCPAEIYISHVVKFPQHEVPESMVDRNCLPSDQLRRSIKRKLSDQYKAQPQSIECQHWYYVRLPQPWAHKGHPVMATAGSADESEVPTGTRVTLNAEAVARMVDKRKIAVEMYQNNTNQIENRRISGSAEGIVLRTKEPVDERVLIKIRALFKSGIEQEKDIRDELNVYVKDELFEGKQPPPSIFRRFNPTQKDVANEIAKAREELRCERIQSAREVCGSLVSEVAHLIPAVEDEGVLDAAQQALHQLYELVKEAVPACISNPDENVVEETTIDEKDGSSCSTGLLLSEHATLVIPQTISLQHQQQQMVQEEHQLQQLQPQQQQQHITYHPNYTITSINNIGGMINTSGAGTSMSTIHQPQAHSMHHSHQTTNATYNEVAMRSNATYENTYRDPKITTINGWYQ